MVVKKAFKFSRNKTSTIICDKRIGDSCTKCILNSITALELILGVQGASYQFRMGANQDKNHYPPGQ